MQGFAEGRFDIAMTAMDNVVAYHEGQGEAKLPPQPEMFAFLGGDPGFLSLVGGQGVRSLADLKGRKLAVDAMTTGFAFVLRELLARGGIAESEVTFDRAGGSPARFNALLKGTHAGAMLTTPYEALAANQGLAVLAKPEQQLGAYQGLVGAARRSWARQNEPALLGYLRAYHAGLAFLYDPGNRDVAEALLVANLRAMTPPLAKQSLEVLLDGKSGFMRDAAVDLKGVETVLALRSKFTGQALSDPAKYVDSTYRNKALGQRNKALGQ
jgi:ABC-type nitrate/sulfonate/bicarbonate transport system substrate-binding protein